MEASGIFRPRRLGHVNLWVDDLARSEAFYREKCGLALEFREPDLLASFLGTGATPHDLGMIQVTKGEDRLGRDGHVQIPKTAGRSIGLGHLALEMENEAALVEGCTRARDGGVPIMRTADHQIARSAYLSDPDGNSVEFYCDTVRDWRGVVQGDVELLTSRWDPWEQQPSLDRNYHDQSMPLPTPEALVHPKRMAHVVLTSNDVARMTGFYQNIAGLKLAFEAEDGSLACFAGTATVGPFDIAICRSASGGSPEYHHVSFCLEDDSQVELAESRVQKAGCVIERRVDNESKLGFFMKDPDGMRIEFHVRRNQMPMNIDNAADAERAFLI